MAKLFNEHVFDRITKDSAYFLGLLFSDGCICKTGYRHLTVLGSKDRDIVLNFKEFMKAKNKITKKKNFYSISLCSKHLFMKLYSLGCIPRKSFVLKKPNILDKYIKSFLLGFFDGDGSLSLNKSINSWKASIGTASKNFAFWIIEVIKSWRLKYNLEIRKTNRKKFFYNITFTGITAKIFLNKLYTSIGKFKPMKRKYELFKKFKICKLRKGPNMFLWEENYIRENISDSTCSLLINNDPRNYGWERNKESIHELRRHRNIKIS